MASVGVLGGQRGRIADHLLRFAGSMRDVVLKVANWHLSAALGLRRFVEVTRGVGRAKRSNVRGANGVTHTVALRRGGWPMEYSVYIELPPGAETTSGSWIHCFGCKMRHILCDDKLLRVEHLREMAVGASTRCEGKTRRVHYWLVTRKHQ